MSPEALRSIRKDARMTQAQFAKLLGLTPSFVGQMERGRRPIAHRTEKVAMYLQPDARAERGLRHARIVKSARISILAFLEAISAGASIEEASEELGLLQLAAQRLGHVMNELPSLEAH